MAASHQCLFDKTCIVVERKCFLITNKITTDEDTDQTYIAKEALLPVTEGIYPERIFFFFFYHNILYSDLDLNSPTPVLKVHLLSKFPWPLLVTVLQV